MNEDQTRVKREKSLSKTTQTQGTQHQRKFIRDTDKIKSMDIGKT